MSEHQRLEEKQRKRRSLWVPVRGVVVSAGTSAGHRPRQLSGRHQELKRLYSLTGSSDLELPVLRERELHPKSRWSRFKSNKTRNNLNDQKQGNSIC